MIEELLQKITKTEEFMSFVNTFSQKVITENIISILEDKNAGRKPTNLEKFIILKCLHSKKDIPLMNLKNVGVNLNAMFLPMSDFLFTLSTSLEKTNDDDRFCELIDKLNECGYNFNERTIYNGSNILLSCVLSFKPKSALKLLQLGVDYNVTNKTQDTIYKSTKDIANYAYEETYDELLSNKNLLDKKDEIINNYKILLNYLEQNNITDNVNDEFYKDIDEYIEKISQANALNEEDTAELKSALYDGIILTVSKIACEICSNL